MSGGVDSSVAAKIMCDRGYKCIGCTMRLYENEDAGISKENTCCSLDDVEDARSVAYSLGMPYYVFNFKDEFKEKVINKFIRCYECGVTPNPCIDCNRYLKFEALYRRAQVLGCDCIVTGHYARIVEENGKYLLKKGLDDTKDQSYVLYSLTQEQLSRTQFPLGDISKTETRAIAEENHFINARKHDSQDICFVPDGDYAKVIELHTGKKSEPGDFTDKDGRVYGRHEGIIHYTVGQHRGLGLHWHEKLYVTAIDAEKNRVILGHYEELFSKELDAEEFNWSSGEVPEGEFRCKVKTRYRHREQPATVIPVGNDRVHVIFDEPQRAVTKGQAAVLYDGDTVLGGGTIV